jgi:hypothetical protein
LHLFSIPYIRLKRLALAIYPSEESKMEPRTFLKDLLVVRNGISFASTLAIVDFVGGILPFRSVQHTESVTWKGDH